MALKPQNPANLDFCHANILSDTVLAILQRTLLLQNLLFYTILSTVILVASLHVILLLLQVFVYIE